MPRRNSLGTVGTVGAVGAVNGTGFRVSKRNDDHASLSQLRESALAAPQREISYKMKRTHSNRRVKGTEGQWNSESLAMQFASCLDDQREQQRQLNTIQEDRSSAMSHMSHMSHKSSSSTRAPQATRLRPCAHRIHTTVRNESTLAPTTPPLRSLSRGVSRSGLAHKKQGFMTSFSRVEEEVAMTKRQLPQRHASTPRAAKPHAATPPSQVHTKVTGRSPDDTEHKDESRENGDNGERGAQDEQDEHKGSGDDPDPHSQTQTRSSDAPERVSRHSKRASGCSFFSESPSMAGIGMRQKQYTLDTLDEALMYDGEVGAMPDRDQLRDQIEWDIGVYDTLRQLKQLQIREQIALDTRHQQSLQKAKDRKASTSKTSDNQRPSLNDYISAVQTGAPIPGREATVAPSRAAKRLLGEEGNLAGFGPRKTGVEDGSVGRRSLFEDLADTAEMSRLRWYVIDPQRWRFQLWSVITEVVLFMICIIEPFRIGRFAADNSTLNYTMMYCDIQLLLDLVLHFFVAYDDELRDIQVTSLRHIVSRYLQAQFGFDLIVALPWNVVTWKEDTQNALDVLRMTKLLGAHRLLSTRSVFSNAPDAMMFNPSLITLWKMMLTIMFVWHWVGCMYWLVAAHRYDVDEPVLDDNDVWTPPESVLQTNYTHVRYAYALTWAIGVTTGGTFPTPSTMLQLVYGNAVTIVGFLLMSLVIGSATTALSDLQAQSSEISIRLQHIDRYMRYKRLPSSIRRRIVQFYRFQYTSLNRIDENEVLVGLPRALRVQMQLIMHKQIFTQLPLFWLCSEEEILLITQRLRPCVIMPGEMLIKQDRLAVGLFLLMKGAVETLRDGELVIVLLAVAAFGENALRGTPSNCSIRALRFCETTVLLREDFAVIEQMNPVVRRWLDVYILERDRKLANPQTRRQSLETKSAAVKSTRCKDGWHTDDSKSLLGRRSGTDTAARRMVSSVSNVVLALRLRRARRQRKTRARASLASVGRAVQEKGGRPARKASIIDTLRTLRAQRLGSMSGALSMMNSTNADSSTTTATTTTTSSSSLASRPVRPVRSAVKSSGVEPSDLRTSVRFSNPDDDEAEKLGFLDGLNVVKRTAGRVSFQTQRFGSTPPLTDKTDQPRQIRQLTRRSVAEIDTLHEHTPSGSSSASTDLFTIKDHVNAKCASRSMSNEIGPPNKNTTPTKTTQSNRSVPQHDMRDLLGANLHRSNRRSSTCAAVNFTGFESALGAREDDDQATWRDEAAILSNFKYDSSCNNASSLPETLDA